MGNGDLMTEEPERSQLWIWWVCGLLLLASTINYMDRQTLSNTAVRIKSELNLNNEQYGSLETAFGLAFAVGASVFGFIADKTSVRWLYPAVLLLWSAMGFQTGFVGTYRDLLACRLLLGFFEAGHWPCALKTTQRLLPADKRTLGNSVLQSGTAIGAMVTPLIIRAMLTEKAGSWRLPFQIVGAIGVVWAAMWLMTMSGANGRKLDSEVADSPKNDGKIGDSTKSFLSVICSRKYFTLIIVVIAINLCWHQFRVWMQLFLTSRGYTEEQCLDINFSFNLMTDIGCITAGLFTALLSRHGVTAHAARCWVFGICALLVATGGLIPWLSNGVSLIIVLMTVGFGALGLFPCYYAFTQELSVAHQGKVAGTLGTIAWIFPSLWHKEFGRWVDVHKSYDVGMFLASLMPLVAFAALMLVWPAEKAETRHAD